MKISLLNVKYFITEKNIENLKISELGYMLTILRDNCLNDETYEILNKYVNELFEITKKKTKEKK